MLLEKTVDVKRAVSQEEIRAQAALRQPMTLGGNPTMGVMQHMMAGGQAPMGSFDPTGTNGNGVLPQDNPCKVFCGGLPATVDRGERSVELFYWNLLIFREATTALCEVWSRH